MQAFLATSLGAAWVDIRSDYGPVTRTGNMRGIRKLADGESEAFTIALDERPLRGKVLTEFHVLKHARGVSPDLVRIAESRVRR